MITNYGIMKAFEVYDHSGKLIGTLQAWSDWDRQEWRQPVKSKKTGRHVDTVRLQFFIHPETGQWILCCSDDQIDRLRLVKGFRTPEEGQIQ